MCTRTLRRLLLIAALISLLPSCTKPQPAPRPPAREVPPSETFSFENVRLSYDEGKLKVSYKVTNQSAHRARGAACLKLLDKDGFVVSDLSAGVFGLRAGDDDELVEELNEHELVPDEWHQVKSVAMYAGDFFCTDGIEDATSPVSFLERDGSPLKGARPAVKPLEHQPGPGQIGLEVVRLTSGTDEEDGRLEFKVTNTSDCRVAGRVCVRFYDENACDCRSFDEMPSDGFNLSPGATRTMSSDVHADDAGNWKRVHHFKVYASNFGCADETDEAISEVFTLPQSEPVAAPSAPEGRLEDD